MLSYFDEKVTEYETKLSRGQGFMMAFYAAKCIGADYFYNGIEHDMGTAGDFWDCNPADFEELVPYTFAESNTCGYKGEEPNVWGDTLTAAYLWAFGQRSPVSGNLMFTFDEETGTMNQKGVLTIEEAVSVLARLYDGAVGAVYVSASDIAVTEGFTDHLSAELREKMQEAPVVTAENHPVWTGLILGFAFDRQVNDYSKELRLSANWGFNSARALLDYEPFFDSEVTKVNMTNLQILDELVLFCNGFGVAISGIDVYLPEEYAVERWYTATTYDVYMGYEEEAGVTKRPTSRIMISPNEYNYLTNIEILEDVSFMTEKVWAEASKETIEQWGKHISEFDGNCMVRYEGGCFNGAVWEDMSSYYQDLLDMFVENGFSWWSGDLYWMTNDHTKSIVEAPSMPYSVYPYFNIELLKLLQEHQNSERVPGTQAVEE